MRKVFGALFALVVMVFAGCAAAQSDPDTHPAVEIVKLYVDIQLAQDGSYVETRQLVYRLLSQPAIQAMRQMRLSYTDGYQELGIQAAYTLKADGTRIDVPADDMLKGYGASTRVGFEDLKTVEIVFPKLEPGDEIGLTTVLQQTKPWFPGQFASEFEFSPLVVANDVSISLTAPASLDLHIQNLGLSESPVETANGQTRRTWTFRNEKPKPFEPGAVSVYDTGPALSISTFSGEAQVAEIYRRMIHGKSDVDDTIKAKADAIVAGVTDRKEQAHRIYDWVSTHIGYVDIVLGAGGFVPHEAADVLKNGYGDCKDHVMLLTALLAAEGIVSDPVLIDIGTRYRQPPTASPFVFNHLISYIPEFDLYADSTSRFTPFGELPETDADKPVINVVTGQAVRTPDANPDRESVRITITADISKDGAADGQTQVAATGSLASAYRALLQAVDPASEAPMFEKFLGPGGTGTLDKGNIDALTDPYVFHATFHQEHAVDFPGPAALAYPGFRPFQFTPVLAELPAKRTVPYVCSPMDAEEETTLKFPDGISFTYVPPSQTISADGISLVTQYQKIGPNTLRSKLALHIDHHGMVCTTDYYAHVRPKMEQMLSALRAQVLYRLKQGKAR